MKRITLFYASLVAVLSMFTVTEAAHATPGVATSTLILRAGPSNDYPAVARVRERSGVEIHGCLKGWGWCEIGAGPYRGWAQGDDLMTSYKGKRYPIYDYGERAAVPVVAYEFEPYWDKHYRNKPFYKKREHWSHYNVPSHNDSYRWPSERPRHR